MLDIFLNGKIRPYIGRYLNIIIYITLGRTISVSGKDLINLDFFLQTDFILSTPFEKFILMTSTPQTVY